jgi:hypothetical protein
VLEPRFVRSLSRLASSDEDANSLTCDVAALGRAGAPFRGAKQPRTDPAQHQVQELPGRENHVIELQRPVGPPPRADSPKTGSVPRGLPCLSMRFDQKQAV